MKEKIKNPVNTVNPFLSGNHEGPMPFRTSTRIHTTKIGFDRNVKNDPISLLRFLDGM